jgi:hypothetical protein
MLVPAEPVLFGAPMGVCPHALRVQAKLSSAKLGVRRGCFTANVIMLEF